MIRIISKENGGEEINPRLFSHVLHVPEERKRSRIVVRKGLEHILLRLEDVALMYTENKVVFVFDREGRKYIGEKNLADLYEELDSQAFFRANRQYIVNIEFVKSYKTYEKVKLLVTLSIPELAHHQVIVSQENAPNFRQWIGGQ